MEAYAERMREEIREKIEKGDLNFQRYHFPEIDFRRITKEFKGPVDFSKAVFHGDVKFGGITFRHSANFNHAKFSGYALFYMATFLSYANFNFCRFEEIAVFDGVAMSKVHFSFRNTLFGRGVSVDAELWHESGFSLLTENFDLTSAAESYQALRRGFENMGHYKVAAELFYREMSCRKREYP